MGNFCCLRRPSESSVTSAAQVAPDDAPALRICFAVRIQGNIRTRWEYKEYQIRFRNINTWRCAFELGSGSSGQGDEVNNNTELDMTAAELDGGNMTTAECNGGEKMTKTECDGEAGDGGAVNLKSHWSLSTTHSTLSLETTRASGKRCSRKDASIKTSSPSNSVQTMRLNSKQTDSAKQPQQALTLHQSQEQSTSDCNAEDIEEEIRRHREDSLQRLEGKYDDTIINRLVLTFQSPFGREKSQPQFGTLNYQRWAKLSTLIASGTRDFPPLMEEQEAVLLSVEQNGKSFKVKMQNPGKTAVLCDVKAAMKQIETWKWENAVILVRSADTPQEQRKWRTMEEPQVLDWRIPSRI